MRALLDLLRDDAWNGVQGLLALAGTAVVLARLAFQSAPRVYWWWYDLYYEHVRWRLYGPPPGFNETASITVEQVRPGVYRLVDADELATSVLE